MDSVDLCRSIRHAQRWTANSPCRSQIRTLDYTQLHEQASPSRALRKVNFDAIERGSTKPLH